MKSTLVLVLTISAIAFLSACESKKSKPRGSGDDSNAEDKSEYSSSGVGNAAVDPILSARIESVEFDASYVGVRGKKFLNLESVSEERGPVRGRVVAEGEEFDVELPARSQRLVPINDDLFILVRFPIGLDYSSYVKGDAHLVRKSDGRSWHILAGVVDPDKIKSRRVGRSTQVYIPSSAGNYDCRELVQFPTFNCKEFQGRGTFDELRMVTLRDGDDRVSIKTLIDDFNMNSNFFLVGQETVAIMGADVWITGLNSNPEAYGIDEFNLPKYDGRYTRSGAFSHELSEEVHTYRVYGDDVRSPKTIELNANEHTVRGIDFVGELDAGKRYLIVGNRRMGLDGGAAGIVDVENASASDSVEFDVEFVLPGSAAFADLGEYVLHGDKGVCAFRYKDEDLSVACATNPELNVKSEIVEVVRGGSGRYVLKTLIADLKSAEEVSVQVDWDSGTMAEVGVKVIEDYVPNEKIVISVK